MQRIEFRAMGCHMLALSASQTESAGALLNQVPSWFVTWEQALSRFRPDSELSRLNRSSGQWFAASETLWSVLQVALDAAQASDGLVAPTMLDAMEAIGYDRSFEVIRTGVAVLSIRPPAIVDWRDIEFDPSRRAVRLPVGMRLDLGGVAKGWVAEQAAQRLAEEGAALVDAGGDIAVRGADGASEPFPVGVADPWQPEEMLSLVMLSSGGVATSGRDYRRWQANGKPQHHILDPRTGAPAETDVLSATVIAPNTIEAEVAAKVAFILGSGAGMDWIEAHPGLAALLALEDGNVIRSSRFADYEWHPSEEGTSAWT